MDKDLIKELILLTFQLFIFKCALSKKALRRHRKVKILNSIGVIEKQVGMVKPMCLFMNIKYIHRGSYMDVLIFSWIY